MRKLVGVVFIIIAVSFLYAGLNGDKIKNVVTHTVIANNTLDSKTAEVRALEQELKFYREVGDYEMVESLLAKINKLTGAKTIKAKIMKSDCELKLDAVNQTYEKGSAEWGSSGHLAYTGYDDMRPFIYRDPHSNMLYAVVEQWQNDTTSTFRIYKSTDGHYWFAYYRPSFMQGVRRTYPSITADSGYLYVSYIYSSSSTISLFTFKISKTDTSDHDYIGIVSTSYLTSPFIVSDYIHYTSETWLYLAYYDGDMDTVYLARSTDHGGTWSIYPAAYSPECWGLSLNFELVGTSGDHMTLTYEYYDLVNSQWDIWFADGGYFGSSWSGWTDLTQTTTKNEYFPFHKNVDDYIIVAYQHYYGPDWDINLAYSTDGGATWNSNLVVWYTWEDDILPTVAIGLSDTFYVAFIVDDDTLTAYDVDTAQIHVIKMLKGDPPTLISDVTVNDSSEWWLTHTGIRPFVIASEGIPFNDSSFVGVAWTKQWMSLTGDFDVRWDYDFQEIVSVEEEPTTMLNCLRVIPEKGGVSVNLGLKRSSPVSLNLYDVSGRLIRRKDLGVLSAGFYTRRISLPHSGVYFLIAKVGNGKFVRKTFTVR